jgi:hypothetical protein
MKTCVKCGQSKPIREFSFVGIRRPNLRRTSCKKCCSIEAKKYHKENKEKVRARKALYRLEHHDSMLKREREDRKNRPEKYLEWSRKYNSNNREKKLESCRKYNRDNKEKRLEQGRAWTKRNLAYCAAKQNRKRASKLKATPPWANGFFIEEIYDLAQRRSKTLGVPYEVDHIVPLINEKVCGLHWEGNLQVITASANRSKGNKFTL